MPRSRVAFHSMQPTDHHPKVTLTNTAQKSHPPPQPDVALIGALPGHIRPVNACVHACVCMCVFVSACVCPCGCLCLSEDASAAGRVPFASGILCAYTVKTKGIRLRFR